MEDIPSRELKEFDLEDNVEGVFVEINLRKSEWLLLAAYNSPSLSETICFDTIGNALDYYSRKLTPLSTFKPYFRSPSSYFKSWIHHKL